MLQAFDVAIRCSSQRAAFKLFTTEQLRSHNYVYGDSNDIHNVATSVLLTQQLFTVLFFLVKLKTLGLTLEPGLAAKLCAKALSVNDCMGLVVMWSTWLDCPDLSSNGIR